MKRKCIKCGKLIDTECDEFLMTAEGPLCIDCANEGYDGRQESECDNEGIDQTYM